MMAHATSKQDVNLLRVQVRYSTVHCHARPSLWINSSHSLLRFELVLTSKVYPGSSVALLALPSRWRSVRALGTRYVHPIM